MKFKYWNNQSFKLRRSDMKKFLSTVVLLTVIATPAFAQSFDPDNGTGNVLALSQNVPENEKTSGPP